MKEEEIVLMGGIIFGFILVSILFCQHVSLIKVKNKNEILKSVIDKLTNENVKLIEELYERQDKP